MAHLRVHRLLSHIRGLVRQPSDGPTADAALLRRFVEHQDEAAFAGLVDRHAGLVWSVCYRVLGHAADAEDAFQATFLVLARKAYAVKRESLPGWLHGVSYRVACKLRRIDMARRQRESRVEPRESGNEPDELTWREVRQVLDAELTRLPEKYRLPLLLCYLEGRTQDEAARELGWALGIFRGRLDRGREQLRKRLLRRGLGLPAALAATLAAQSAVDAAALPALRRAAVQAALAFTAVTAAPAELVTSNAWQLAEGCLQTMTSTQWKPMAGLVLALLVLAGGAALVAKQLGADRPEAPQAAGHKAPPPEPQAEKSKEQTEPDSEPLPPGAIARLGTARKWQGSVRCVAFSPDGKYLASGGEDRSIHVWDLATRKERFTLKGHAKTLRTIAFSPDGKALASAGGELDGAASPIYLWDFARRKQLGQLTGLSGEIVSIAFSPDGKNLVAGSHSVCRWEVSTGSELLLPGRDKLDLGGDVSSVAYSPDGKFLAVTGFGTRAVVLIDLRSETLIRLPTNTTNCPIVGFSSDGKYVASAGGDSFRFFDPTTGKEQQPFGDGSVSFFGFASRSTKVAWSNGRGTVRYGDLVTCKEARPFATRRSPITCVAVSPDGKQLASGSDDGTILIWDATGILRNEEHPSAEEDEAKELPVPDDGKIHLVLDKSEYFLGENILVHFCVENTGMGLFYVNVGGDYRGVSRHRRFSVTATDMDGKGVPDPDPSGFCLGGISSSPAIKPGEKHYESLPLMRYCRFEKAGMYKLRVSHGLGWRETGQRKVPVAEATIRLVMPTEQQARKIVEEMYRLPAGYGGTSGEKTEPYADFATLAYPVYLSILAPRAADGCEKALLAIGHIPTPEATQVLIRLLDHKDTAFAREAARTLNMRLPDPQLDGKLSGRSVFENDQADARRWLVKQAWRPAFKADARAAARKLLFQSDRESLECGAFMMECLGEPEDLPTLIRALDWSICQTRKNPPEERVYPRPRGACRELLRATKILIERGGEVPRTPENPGEAAAFVSALGTQPGFRPKDWEQTVTDQLRHPIPYVREIALANIPSPMPPVLLKVVPALLADKDIDVQIAACHLAERSKEASLKQPVLQVLATGKERWLLNAASNAAYALEAGYELIELWVSRLEEEGMTAIALDYLASSVIADRSSSSIPTPGMLSAEEGKAIKARWMRFLQEHGKALKEGQRIKLGEPVLTPDLFPKFTFDPPRKPMAP